MVPAEETFDGTFPFQPRFSTASGFRMHYVDQGAGEPVVLLHGEPTWGYIYRRFIAALSKRWRVVVPDHMGFGKSETPPDRRYTLRTHVENLSALLDELELDGITFVGQDWGGPMLAAYTVRHPDRVRRIVLLNSLCGYGAWVAAPGSPKPPPLHKSDWFRWVAAGLEDGTYAATMRDLGRQAGPLMARLGLRSRLGAAQLRAYAAPFATPEECEGAYQFPLDVALGRIRSYLLEGRPGVEALRTKPAMLAEGMLDRAIQPEAAIADFSALFPDGPVFRLDEAGHFCQEDAPEELIGLIERFLATS